MTARPAYLFDNSSPTETRRLGGIQSVWDEGTTALLTGLGVGPGWRCLEVGAGAGSVAGWLAETCAPTGSVVATDIDTSLLAERPGMEVWRHDLVTDDLPAGEFDLVHARLVLQHLPAGDELVAKLARSVKATGWLVLEDTDWGPLFGAATPQEPFVRLKEGLRRIMSARGFDPACGAAHAGRMLALGLEDVGVDARLRLLRGGDAGSDWYRLWVEALRDDLVDRTDLSDEELRSLVLRFSEPDFAWLSQLMIATVGRAPAFGGGGVG